MANDWIIDVLEDLAAFAAANGLQLLEMQLGVTTQVAAAEIASSQGISSPMTGLGHAGQQLRALAESAGY